jgi:excisionase family DNA binding protein
MLLRIDEVSRALRLGRSQVYQLCAAGKLPTIRIGRSVRVPADALREWVRRETVGIVAADAGGGLRHDAGR